MLMLTSYMDETGHLDDPNFHHCGMAGFVAPAVIWDPFANHWQDILDSFNLKKPFHMKDFAHFHGEFEYGWREDEGKRRALYGALIDAILELGPTPVGVVVSVGSFNSLTESQKSNLRDPYYVCFQTCTRGAAIEALCFEDEKVAMVYSYNEEFGAIPPKEQYSVDQAGSAENLWHAMKRLTDFGKWMGSYASKTPSEMVQLQAADLFAYELGKEFENITMRPKLEMRWGLKQIILNLTSPGYARIRVMDRKALLRIIKESNLGFREGVDEIDADQEFQERITLARHLASRTETSRWKMTSYRTYLAGLEK
jgi:hypothetical protein